MVDGRGGRSKAWAVKGEGGESKGMIGTAGGVDFVFAERPGRGDGHLWELSLLAPGRKRWGGARERGGRNVSRDPTTRYRTRYSSFLPLNPTE